MAVQIGGDIGVAHFQAPLRHIQQLVFDVPAQVGLQGLQQHQGVLQDAVQAHTALVHVQRQLATGLSQIEIQVGVLQARHDSLGHQGLGGQSLHAALGFVSGPMRPMALPFRMQGFDQAIHMPGL